MVLSSAGTPAAAGVATYDIVPSGASGNSALSNYDIQYVNGTLTVNPAHLTVTGNSPSRQYGDANPTLSGAVSGFVNGQTLATSRVAGSAHCTTTAGVTSGVGTLYPVTCDQGTLSATNYDFTTFTDGVLTVTARQITVTADAGQHKTYGDSDPTLTWSTGSGDIVNGDTPSGHLTRASGETVGLYPIYLGTLTYGSNYSISYTGDNFEITQKSATVTASAQSKTYGQVKSLGTTAFTTSGFASGEAPAAVVLSSAGTPAAAGVATYDIVPSGASGNSALSNYDIQYVNGTLTVNPAHLTVTGNSPSRRTAMRTRRCRGRCLGS